MSKDFCENDLKATKVDLSGIRNRAASRLDYIARRNQSLRKAVYAIVTGSDGVEHNICFESVAKVNEALANMMGLQISVHRPQHNEFLH